MVMLVIVLFHSGRFTVNVLIGTRPQFILFISTVFTGDFVSICRQLETSSSELFRVLWGDFAEPGSLILWFQKIALKSFLQKCYCNITQLRRRTTYKD